MNDQIKLDRTWLCTVVFIDIVRYSEQTVELQMTWKARLNHYLGTGIQDVPEGDRVILDTGDGAAVCFLGDPEAAMFCALKMLGALIQEEPRHEPGMRARIGLNLGPVKLVRDINGNLNALGDGINVGQRVMSFAGENQVLVSRSFYEVVSCLSESYHDLFRFGGVRKDKHIREHTVYELQLPGSGPRQPAGTLHLAPERRPQLQLDDAALERVEGHLARAIGPIARYLARNAAATASTSEELCRAVSAFIPSKAEQEAFLRACGVSATREPAPSSPPPARDPDGPAAAWAPDVLDRIASGLAMFMGPMARLLVGRASTRARSEEELYALLAAEISSPGDRDAFLRLAPRTPAPES